MLENCEGPRVVLQDLSSWVTAMTKDTSLFPGGKKVLHRSVETVLGFFGWFITI